MPDTRMPWEADSELNRPATVRVRRSDGTGEVATCRWDSPFLIVGRRSDCDLCLNHATVSARHLYLQKVPGCIVVFDLGSQDLCKRTGVLGRAGCQLVDRLLPGEEVQVGAYWLSVTEDGLTETLADAGGKAVPKLPGPAAVWELTTPASVAAARPRIVIQHAITLIGRGPQCRVKLAEESVSTTHASLVSIHGDLYVIDLCSRYGVKVNGALVKSARLVEGDELAIGECIGRIHFPAVSAPKLVVPPALEVVELPVLDDAVVEPAAVVDLKPVEFPENLHCEVKPDSDDSLTVRIQPSLSNDALIPEPVPLQAPSVSDEMFDLQTVIERCAGQQGEVREYARHVLESVQTRLDHPPATPDSASTSPTQSMAAKQKNRRFPRAVPATKASTEDQTPPNPDLHVWLNHRLAKLDAPEEKFLTQFWKTLTGLF